MNRSTQNVDALIDGHLIEACIRLIDRRANQQQYTTYKVDILIDG